VTTRTNGETPLHLACLKGHTGVVQALLDSDADVENNTRMTVIACEMQWCVAIRMSRHVNICVTVEECFNNARMTVITCEMQWCVAIHTSSHVNICATVEECFNNICMTI
jgi:hypothetical protein